MAYRLISLNPHCSYPECDRRKYLVSFLECQFVYHRLPDKIINAVCVAEQRILITKDSDFFDSFIVKNEPHKLTLVKLGNTSKNELIKFFSHQFNEIIEKIKVEDMILLSKDE